MDRRPAIFLDRDGVINEDVHHLSCPADLRLIPGSAQAIAALNRAGWVVVVITNQSGVARGLFDEAAVTAVHEQMTRELSALGAQVDAFHHCPHHPDGTAALFAMECDCRKPKPGMLLRAAADLNLDLTRSWMIGDRETDLAAGAAVGCRTILVRTGYGLETAKLVTDWASVNLQLVADSLADAVERCGLGRGPGNETALTRPSLAFQASKGIEET